MNAFAGERERADWQTARGTTKQTTDILIWDLGESMKEGCVMDRPVWSQLPCLSEHDTATVRAALDEVGMARVRARSTGSLVETCRALGEPFAHPDADDDGMTAITFDPRSDRRVASEQGLLPHTDGTGFEHPPDLIAFVCHDASASGGESTFVDMAEVLQRMRGAGVDLAPLFHERAAIFGKPPNAQPRPVLEWTSVDRLRVRLRQDKRGYYGFESFAAVSTMLDLARQCVFVHRLSPGEGYLIDNARILHGRLPYVGHRAMARVLLRGDRTRGVPRHLVDGIAGAGSHQEHQR